MEPVKILLSGWQDSYIDFLADPTEKRTQNQFCKEVGITPGAIYAWKAKHYDFIYQEADKRRQKFKSQLRELAYKALASRLEKSDKAIELALTLTGDLDSKPEVAHYHMLNPDERTEKAKELLSRFGGKNPQPLKPTAQALTGQKAQPSIPPVA